MIVAFVLLAAMLVAAPALGALSAADGPTYTKRGARITVDRAGRVTITP